MGKYDDRDYSVGKGKPPVEHQFKKGASGNPRGPRHKKKAIEATLEVIVHEAVNEKITVSKDGRQIRICKKHAIVVGVVNDAITGTPAQRLKAMKVLQEYGAFNRVVEDDRITPEMREEKIAEFVSQLIEEVKRVDETRHLFEEYN